MVSILWATVYLVVAAVTIDSRFLHGEQSQNATIDDMEASGGMHLVDDMMLDEDQWSALRQRKAIDKTTHRWDVGHVQPDGNKYPTIDYVFQTTDPVVCTNIADCSSGSDQIYFKANCRMLCDKDNGIDVAAVEAGIAHWKRHTCIKFKDKTNQMLNPKRTPLQFNIQVNQGYGPTLIGRGDLLCQSGVGKQAGGTRISIPKGYCSNFGTVVHEIGHAMGFWHEQNRSDRDDFVEILNNKNTFNYMRKTDNNYCVPYDYSSVMHYDGRDMVAKDPRSEEIIGTSVNTPLVGLSHRDKLLANRMYNCIDKWMAQTNKPKCAALNGMDPCLNDGYTGENCECVCPPGTTDAICGTVTGDYYDPLQNPLSEKITTMKSIKVETINAQKKGYSGSTFVKWIVPPACKTAKVTFTYSNLNPFLGEYVDINEMPNGPMGPKSTRYIYLTSIIVTSMTGINITTKYYTKSNTFKTLWEAKVTFDDNLGCTAPVPPPTGCSAFTRSWSMTGMLSGSLKFKSTVEVSDWKIELMFDQDLSGFTKYAAVNGKISGSRLTLTAKGGSYSIIKPTMNVSWWIKMNYVGALEPKLLSARLISKKNPCMDLCK